MDKRIRIGLIMLMCTICSVFTVHTFCIGGYEVIAEGKSLGFVDDASTVEAITDKLNSELLSSYGKEGLIKNKIELIEKTDMKKNLTSLSELERNISGLSEFLQEGYILIVDGQDTIAFPDYSSMEKVLYEIQKDYIIDNGDAEFCEKIEYKREYISKTKLYETENAVEYLKNNKILNVRTTVISEYNGAVSFDTIREEDDTMYKGSTVIITEGEAGESLISAEIVYINGEECERKIIKEEIIKQPVNQYEKIGILEPPPGYGTGEFIYPISGRLTSAYGQRWGRLHGGIDLAAVTGTEIVSSDNGKVVFAGVSGSYGLLIKVDHGNGYVTYYAHCSEILADVGDCVSKGEVIALVGNTGNSTGPHCHFEIRYDNNRLDPLNYIE